MAILINTLDQIISQSSSIKIDTVRPRCMAYHCVLEKRSLDRNSLGRGQCYLLGCNFANNRTERARGQYYVESVSNILA